MALLPTGKQHQIDSLFAAHRRATHESLSLGNVGNGSLKYGRIVPFSGANFHYFDTTSYLSKRAFVHQKVFETLIESYKTLEETCPEGHFGLMECSNEQGGKIYPHRTHQNGLSVDFMTPLLKNGVPTRDFEWEGATHYFMDFDNQGHYVEDTSYSIHFNRLAQHLFELNAAAKRNGLQIDKVILKTALKEALFATEYGKKLEAEGIYFATKLTPLINNLHDDHYHVDFKIR